MISHPTKWYAAVPLTAAVLFAAACADNTLAPRSGSVATAPRLAGDAPVGPITGALWTSDLGCGAINKNIYTDRQAVYLNGGPLGNNALNDGAYYVQVTAPDGTLLGTSVGSADAQPFVVVGGKVTSCGSLWEMVIKASDQSIGYDLTTNPGGEYKAWISASADFDNSRSKTDNFKVREPDAPPPPQAALTIQKFYDANADGVKQPTEPFLEGWKVGLTPWGESQEIQFTTYTANRDVGNYESTEFMPIQTNWYRTTPAVIPVQFVLTDAGYTVTYGNVCTGAGGGLTLGYWSNKNGQADLTNLGGGMTANLSRLSGLEPAHRRRCRLRPHDLHAVPHLAARRKRHQHGVHALGAAVGDEQQRRDG
jgi:hypothetical protein